MGLYRIADSTEVVFGVAKKAFLFVLLPVFLYFVDHVHDIFKILRSLLEFYTLFRR